MLMKHLGSHIKILLASILAPSYASTIAQASTNFFHLSNSVSLPQPQHASWAQMLQEQYYRSLLYN